MKRYGKASHWEVFWTAHFPMTGTAGAKEYGRSGKFYNVNIVEASYVPEETNMGKKTGGVIFKCKRPNGSKIMDYYLKPVTTEATARRKGGHYRIS